MITHPILRIFPVGLPTVPWNKKQLKGRHFLSATDFVGRTNLLFFSDLLKLEQWAKKCMGLCGDVLNKSQVWLL
jgi:hypothetical protein